MARHVTPRVPTVLLVESAQDDRGLYADYLRALEFHPIEIGNTAAALALAGTADIIVTGLSVPGPFDGVELVRRLRADKSTQDKPIIVLSAYTFERDRQRAYAAGCDTFLPKPCLPEILVTEMRWAMATRSLSRPAIVA